ncbi:MAG: TRAP transporter substrate-binding protein [Bauldia sp.]
MDRRSFIRGAGIAAAATLAAPAIAQQRPTGELTLLTPFPPGTTGPAFSARRIAERLRHLFAADAAVNITVHHAGEFVPAMDEFAAVADGRATFYYGPDYYYAALHPAMNFFTSVPIGMTAIEHTAWIEQAGGQALWDELALGLGVKPFLAGNSGMQMGGWFRRPLTSVADIEGLRFRMPGLGGEVWRRLGAVVSNEGPAAIVAALENGTLDGADWIGPWDDMRLGLHRVASHYYHPGLLEAGPALTLGVSKAFWDGLGDADREAIAAAARSENSLVLSEFHFNNATALRELRTVDTVSIERFPDDVIAAMARVAPEVAEAAAVDDIGQRIHDSYFAALDLLRGWSELSEGELVTTRARILG